MFKLRQCISRKRYVPTHTFNQTKRNEFAITPRWCACASRRDGTCLKYPSQQLIRKILFPKYVFIIDINVDRLHGLRFFRCKQ